MSFGVGGLDRYRMAARERFPRPFQATSSEFANAGGQAAPYSSSYFPSADHYDPPHRAQESSASGGLGASSALLRSAPSWPAAHLSGVYPSPAGPLRPDHTSSEGSGAGYAPAPESGARWERGVPGPLGGSVNDDSSISSLGTSSRGSGAYRPASARDYAGLSSHGHRADAPHDGYLPHHSAHVPSSRTTALLNGGPHPGRPSAGSGWVGGGSVSGTGIGAGPGPREGAAPGYTTHAAAYPGGEWGLEANHARATHPGDGASRVHSMHANGGAPGWGAAPHRSAPPSWRTPDAPARSNAGNLLPDVDLFHDGEDARGWDAREAHWAEGVPAASDHAADRKAPGGVRNIEGGAAYAGEARARAGPGRNEAGAARRGQEARQAGSREANGSRGSRSPVTRRRKGAAAPSPRGSPPLEARSPLDPATPHAASPPPGSAGEGRGGSLSLSPVVSAASPSGRRSTTSDAPAEAREARDARAGGAGAREA
ncbi:hypothetical protein T484DRAFT_1906869, partial [Baffinella frigidus]